MDRDAGAVALIGDSHLDYLPPAGLRLLQQRMSPRPVISVAVGGMTVHDLPRQLAHASRRESLDAVVVSIGTNDAAVGISQQQFREHLLSLVGSGDLPAARVILASPGISDRAASLFGLAADTIDGYSVQVAGALAGPATRVVDASRVVDRQTGSGFVSDGVHLADAAYHRLAPQIAAALEQVLG